MLQVIDIFNLAIAIIALLFSVVALRVSRNLQQQSISSSFLLGKLDEIHRIADDVRSEANFAADGGNPYKTADNLYKSLKPYRLIMEASGLSQCIEKIENTVLNIQSHRNQANELIRKGHSPEEIADYMKNSIDETVDIIQKSLDEIQGRIEDMFKSTLIEPLKSRLTRAP